MYGQTCLFVGESASNHESDVKRFDLIIKVKENLFIFVKGIALDICRPQIIMNGNGS